MSDWTNEPDHRLLLSLMNSPESEHLTEDGRKVLDEMRDIFEDEEYELAPTPEAIMNGVNWLVRRGYVEEQHKPDAALLLSVYIASVKEQAQWN